MAAMTDESLQVTIRPGLPGQAAGHDRSEVPSTIEDCVQTLTDLGAQVSLEDPGAEVVTLRSGDLWLPILVFGSQVAAGALGQLVASLVEALISRAPSEPSVVRVRVERFQQAEPAVVDIEGSPEHVTQILRDLE